MPSQNLYVEVLASVPQNVTLFENRVTEDVGGYIQMSSFWSWGP